MCCLKPKMPRGITNVGGRCSCVVVQGVHCTSAPDHRRERKVEIQSTDGDLHGGWMDQAGNIRTSTNATSLKETTRCNMPPDEAIGDTQHCQRIILTKPKPNH